MAKQRSLRRQPAINNMYATFSGVAQVSAANTITAQVPSAKPLTVNTATAHITIHNTSDGNRTFFFGPTPPPSPSTSAGSYHTWRGNTRIAPLRTLGGQPWHIPGDHGEGYQVPSDVDVDDFSNDSRSSASFRSRSSVYSEDTITLATVRTNSMFIRSDVSFIAMESAYSCGLRTAISLPIKSATNLLKSIKCNLPQLSSLPTPQLQHQNSNYPIHTPTTIALRLNRDPCWELSLIYHSSRDISSAAAFMGWFFGFYDIRCRVNGSSRRVQFPEPKYARLPPLAMAVMTAADLEGGMLWVERDSKNGDIRKELAGTLRGFAE